MEGEVKKKGEPQGRGESRWLISMSTRASAGFSLQDALWTYAFMD